MRPVRKLGSVARWHMARANEIGYGAALEQHRKALADYHRSMAFALSDEMEGLIGPDIALGLTLATKGAMVYHLRRPEEVSDV